MKNVCVYLFAVQLFGGTKGFQQKIIWGNSSDKRLNPFLQRAMQEKGKKKKKAFRSSLQSSAAPLKNAVASAAIPFGLYVKCSFLYIALRQDPYARSSGHFEQWAKLFLKKKSNKLPAYAGSVRGKGNLVKKPFCLAENLLLC